MSDRTDLAALDATAQAALVASGEATAAELVDAAIARIEKLNPKLNAVIIPLFEKARSLANSRELLEGPFRGVPFLLKDLHAGEHELLGPHQRRDGVHLRYAVPPQAPLPRCLVDREFRSNQRGLRFHDAARRARDRGRS